MCPDLERFLRELDAWRERIPLPVLEEALTKLPICLDDVREFAAFGTVTYRRNLMYAGPAYQALILCWRNGQRSPIHDHRGSSCGVRVLHGVATETFFTRSGNGMIVATGSRELRAPAVCGSEDTDIHQMSNLQAGNEDLVTLHVYSPPLLRMGTYALADPAVRDWDDPVYQYCHGAGI